MGEILLKAEKLEKQYILKKDVWSRKKIFHALNGVSFSVEKGKTLGIVGESGCGKSTIAKGILNLIPLDGGKVYFEDECLFDREKKKQISQKEMRSLRKKIQIVFQDPSSCLDPRKNIEQIICEGVKKHKICEKENMREYCIDIMQKCGLDKNLLMRYPHELSGGQKQRVAIARAFALKPDFIVCDEITSALDVSVQSQILNLLLDLQEESQMTYLFISHNLDVVKNFCDDVIIMYMGRIVEEGKCREIYENPVHPYTKLLMNSIPAKVPEERGKGIGIVKEEHETGENGEAKGCDFFARCPYAGEQCKELRPELKMYSENHRVACYFSGECENL